MGERKINIVDIGANPIDGIPSYMHLVDKGEAVVYGFEPQPSAFEQLVSYENKIYLPYAIGDGGWSTLHICQASGMTSLLEPDFDQLNKMENFAHHATVLQKVPMQTHRLDKIAELQNVEVDILRMDCQGSEMDVLLYADRILKQAFILETEVSFFTLYKGQEDFAAICNYLNAKGWEFHNFLALKSWQTTHGWQLIEGDAVFINSAKTGIKNLIDKVYKKVSQ